MDQDQTENNPAVEGEVEGEREEGIDEVTYLGGNQAGGTADAINYVGGGGASAGDGLKEEDDLFKRMLHRRPTTKYRETSIGRSLTGALNEMLEGNKISAELYNKTLCQFDRTMLSSLSQKLTSRVAFRSGKLQSYKYMDGVWNFELNNVEFREYNSFANVSKVKIAAFDGKGADTQKMTGGKRRWGQNTGGEPVAGTSGTAAGAGAAGPKSKSK